MSLLNVAIVVAFLTTSFGCTKDDQPVPPATEVSSDPEIEKLKVYLAKLINADLSLISYKEDTQMFYLMTYPQINKVDLTKSYLNSLKAEK